MNDYRKKDRSTFNLKILGILFVIPALLLITAMSIVPIVCNFILSFFSWNGNSSLKAIGFQNYIQAFTDSVTLVSFYHSVFIAIFSTVIAVLSGLILALMINKMGKKEGSFYRFIFFTPSMTPLTVIGLLFVFILSPDIGLLNNILRLIGLGDLQHAWLAEPGTVLWSIVIIGGWRFVGVAMMFCYTAIVAIPSSMFEACRIDGAGYIKQVQMIILPLIKPTIQLTTMMLLMWSYKTYDIVWAMTKGGPGDLSRTIPVRMLETGFTFNQFGYSSAIGVLLTILVSISVWAVQRSLRGEIYEY